MVRLCRNLFLIVALATGGVSLLPAAGSAESRAYAAAEKAFQIEAWEYAQKLFDEYVLRYPESTQVPEATLYHAKANYQLQNFPAAVELLSTNRSKAGMWGDEYLYWMAQAQLRLTNFTAAASCFGELNKSFPDSPRRLEAALAQATAIFRLGEWRQVTALLAEPTGAFQQAASSEPDNDYILRGYLLLGQSQLALHDFKKSRAALDFLDKETSSRELTWRREYLRCQLALAEGQTQTALQNASNLLVIAGASLPTQPASNAPPRPELPGLDAETAAGLRSESWTFLAGVFEQMGRFDDAIWAYQKILANAPVDPQRYALFKIADLYIDQNKDSLATKTLEDYLSQHPDSGAADMALLTMGELQLKQYELARKGRAPSAGTTNLIDQALGRFDRMMTTFPQSPLFGRALLDKGWCFWLADRYAESQEFFRRAAGQLPFSNDQAVARFKWADSQLMLQDFAGAATNYNFVATHYGSLADSDLNLSELALYQTLRAALTNDVTLATAALRKILESYPDGFAGPQCLLLLGQGISERGDPAGARSLFTEFESRYPTNSLLPEVRLAIARTYKQERNWDAARSQYDEWITRFTNHAELPRAEFSRAWVEYMAGRPTNAFTLFTNFITRFPTHAFARQAQWWIADYYFGRGQFREAEINYQWVYRNTNWAPSELTYQAQMMSGFAAVAHFGYKDAFGYFTNLAANPACPLDLRIQASFQAADALILRTDPDATNLLEEAISWFNAIPESYPTNALAAEALGRVGDCYLQLSNYEKAAAAYQRVTNSPLADVAARSHATIGLGLVAEGLARLRTGDEQADAQRSGKLFEQALEYYLSVFIRHDLLRPGEEPDLFWVRKAGQEAARVSELLQRWQQAINIYQELENRFPQLGLTLEKKILNAQKNAVREKKSGRLFDSATRGG